MLNYTKLHTRRNKFDVVYIYKIINKEYNMFHLVKQYYKISLSMAIKKLPFA